MANWQACLGGVGGGCWSAAELAGVRGGNWSTAELAMDTELSSLTGASATAARNFHLCLALRFCSGPVGISCFGDPKESIELCWAFSRGKCSEAARFSMLRDIDCLRMNDARFNACTVT